jgi:predicted RNA-binding protein (virulence factor B family)
MAQIGKINRLVVLRKVSIGVYLDGDTLGDLLVPNRYVPEGTKEGDELDVFIYLDSEDRLIATTETPYALVGDFALLKVVATTGVGAFLDWGLMKDLLVPFSEQQQKMAVGNRYLVHVYLDDNTKRIVASAKIEKFLDNLPPEYTPGDEVQLMIAGKTDLGYKAIINNVHTGILYSNQVFKPLVVGQEIKGYIQKVREDEKIDLLLEKPGHEKIDDISESILEKLRANKGFLKVTDKSEPDEIAKMFGLSKKNFKKAIGTLYKKRMIKILDNGIQLV